MTNFDLPQHECIASLKTYRVRLKKPPSRIDRLLKNELIKWTASVDQTILLFLDALVQYKTYLGSFIDIG